VEGWWLFVSIADIQSCVFLGIAKVEMVLSKQPELGNWTVRVNYKVSFRFILIEK